MASVRFARGSAWMYIGTYTRENSKGIYVCRLDAATGQVSTPELAAETVNPSFVALHPNRKFLYAVSEVSTTDGQKSGAVGAFSVDPNNGKLAFLNRAVSRGTGPCYVAVDKSGANALVANYGSGSIAVVPIKSDGSLAEPSMSVQHIGTSVNPKRQTGPHAHSINVAPDNKFVLSADLGLDQLLVYRFNPEKGTLAPNDPSFGRVKPGAGPRHFAFHPNGKFVYVINEMGNTVTAFAWDAARGALADLQTITTLPAGFSGESYCAEVQVHPSGKFLYGSNRGHDSIAVFAVDERRGTLTEVEQVSTRGKWPRNFGIDPTGSYLVAANQNSHNLTVFRIDSETGRLKASGQPLDVGSPVCVRFLAL